MIWAPHFRRWSHLQHLRLSYNLNNLLSILQSVTLSTSTPDARHWKLKNNGLFTVNSLYRSLTGYHNENNCFRCLWTTQTPLKTKVHMWPSRHDRLLTADNLTKRGIHISSLCMFCGDDPKTNVQIFLQCPTTLELWTSEHNCLAISSWPTSIASLRDDWRLSNILRNEVDQCDCLVTATIWVVWKERNRAIFHAKAFLQWCLGGRFLLWWLYGALTSRYTNVISRRSLFTFSQLRCLLFTCDFAYFLLPYPTVALLL